MNYPEHGMRWQGTASGDDAETFELVAARPEWSGSVESGTASDEGAHSATVLEDDTKTWTNDQWIGYLLVLTAGEGAGQSSVISDNDDTTLTVAEAFSTPPDDGTEFIIKAPSGLKPVMTSVEITAVTSDAGTLTIQSSDPSGELAPKILGVYQLPLVGDAATAVVVAQSDILRWGQVNGNVEAVLSADMGSISINADGFWLTATTSIGE